MNMISTAHTDRTEVLESTVQALKWKIKQLEEQILEAQHAICRADDLLSHVPELFTESYPEWKEMKAVQEATK